MSNFSFKLTQLHKQLDEQRCLPDTLRLLRLKRLRLNVKDRLHARLRQQPG
jgi:hypothetical protein